MAVMRLTAQVPVLLRINNGCDDDPVPGIALVMTVLVAPAP